MKMLREMPPGCLFSFPRPYLDSIPLTLGTVFLGSWSRARHVWRP